jgi:hypothetical protein
VKLGFDPDQRTRISRGERWSSRGGGWEHLPGLQAKRLMEETGIPPVVDIVVDLAKRLLLRTAVWLADPAPGPALGAILRVSDYEKDETFDDFFNRSRIALLADSQVETLVGRVERALDYGVPRAAAAMTEEDNDRSTYWIGRTRVAVEVLSRLVLRLDGVKAEQVLDRALSYYRLPLFRQHLIEPLKHLFSRTLTTLDPARIRAYLAKFLTLPLPNEGDFDTDSPNHWPDPFRMAADRFGTASTLLSTVPEFDQAVDRLITAVASTPVSFPRWPAIKRLEVLLRWGILTEEQRARLGEAVWRHRQPGDGFPEESWPPFHLDFVFLFLPSPEPELAERLFRQRYLTSQEAPQLELPTENLLQNLLGAVESPPKGEAGLALMPAEAEQVLERILPSWKSGQLRRVVKDPPSWRGFFHLEYYRGVFARVLGRVILPRLDPLSTKVGEIVQMVADLRSLDFPVEAIYPALARLRPDLLPEISDRLRQSLASSQREQADAAVEAVWWWLREGQRLDLGEPPADLVREIAIAVSMRRPSLQPALRAAEWILRNNAVIEADRFARLVAEGLGYLLSAARYEAGLVRQPVPSFRPNEIVEVRILCVKVALALERAGFGGLHAVGEWIREGQVDPLPEVRHALGESETASL